MWSKLSYCFFSAATAFAHVSPIVKFGVILGSGETYGIKKKEQRKRKQNMWQLIGADTPKPSKATLAEDKPPELSLADWDYMTENSSKIFF